MPAADPPIYVAEPPALLPLVQSSEADDIESELKAQFLFLFETRLREGERFVNTLGMPHLGPSSQIEQSLAVDGLSIYRGAAAAGGAGAYLLRSWRAYNPKRGLALLKTYLQLLWPNVWRATQMWQDKALAYPDGLVEEDGGNHYLTSRVHVTLPSRATTGGDVSAISSGLRASLPARMVLTLSITTEEEFSIGVAMVYRGGLVVQGYEGTFI